MTPRLPALALVDVSIATAYHFRDPDRRGYWAIVTINDSSYELNIQSDWGTWSHRWYVTGMPTRDGKPLTLSEFLYRSIKAGDAYVANKLWPGTGYGGQQFCPEQTLAALKSLVARTRRQHAEQLDYRERLAQIERSSGPWAPRFSSSMYWTPDLLTAKAARQLWDALEEFDLGVSEEVFYERLYNLNWHGIDMMAIADCRQTKTDPAYTILRQVLLPALEAAIRDRLGLEQPIVEGAPPL